MLPIVDGALAIGKSALDAFTAGVNWSLEKLRLKNTPEMKKADVCKKTANENDQINKDVECGSDDKLRDRLSP